MDRRSTDMIPAMPLTAPRSTFRPQFKRTWHQATTGEAHNSPQRECQAQVASSSSKASKNNLLGK